MASQVVTVSDSCRESLKEIAGFRSVNVIYNGISLSEDSHLKVNYNTSLNQPPWKKQYLTIGFIGEIHPRKGIHVLVEALKEVDFPYELVVIGNGDNGYAEDIRLSVESLQYPAHFLGFRNNVHELYQWIDIVVLPSIQYESFWYGNYRSYVK